MSFKGQLFFDPDSIADIDTDFDSVGSYLVGGDKALLDKAEDAAHTSGDRGLPFLAVRQDADSSLVDTDGDYSLLQVDSSGRLKVATEVSVEASDAEFAEDSAHTTEDTGLHMLAVRQDTLAASVDLDGDYASLKVDADGALWSKDADVLAQLVTIDGVLDNILLDTTAILADTANIDTNVAAILADTASIDSSASAIAADIAALEKIEDAAHSSGDSGIMSLAVRQDTAGTLADTDGDYAPLQVDAAGALRISGDFSNLPNTALENKVVSVTDTATQIDASPLTNRKRIMIQNDGNKPIFIGKSDVTADLTAATGGLRLNKGAVLEWELGPGVAVYGIAGVGNTVNIRLIELS